MDRSIKKLCALLESPDPMRRCAGAIALTELAPKDPAVVKALGLALGSANQSLTTYLLEAFEAIGSSDAVPYVISLLDAEAMETKLRAVTIVAGAGGKVVPKIKARLKEATHGQKLVLVDLLARIHTRDAFRAVLDLLFDPAAEIARATCEAVHRHMADATPTDRAAMHKQVTDLLKSPRVAERERVLCCGLLLLGYIGKPEARTVLLKHADPKMPPDVRRHALIGLKTVPLTGAAAKPVVRQILTYLDEPDDAIVRHALDLLEAMDVGDLTTTQSRKLTEGAHTAVRTFAARKLADSDTAAANRELLALLDHEDGQVSHIAAGALAAHKGARSLLFDALTAEADGDAAWTLAKILKPHAEGLDTKQQKALAVLAAPRLAKGDPRAEPLLYLLRSADAGAADAILRDEGLKHRRAKRWELGVECLRRLIHSELFDDELRYALSVCNLKLSPKDLSPHVRAEDHALRGFHSLLRNRSFKLLAQLQKDKSLETDDLYYVAFHFSEATGEDHDFGIELLQHVAKISPRSREAKAARNKLKIARTP